MTGAAAFVAGLAYELGERRTLDELTDVRENPALLTVLRDNGFDHYCEHAGDISELLVGAIRGAMSRARCTGDEIDAVVVCSGTPTWTLADEGLVLRALANAGVDRAPCVGVSMSESANSNVALGTAAGLVRGGARRVLVATLDWVPVGEGRVTPTAVAVASDGATACVVNNAGGDWIVAGWSSGWNAALSTRPLDGETMGEYAAFQLDGLTQCCQEACAMSGASQAGLRAVVVPNLALPLLLTGAEAVGLAAEQIYVDNVGRNGHVQSGDVLVNLADLSTAGGISPADVVVPFAVGRYTWSGATLIASGSVDSEESP